MARLRPKLSTLELKDLTWWFSTALVGGGVPNIIVGLPRGLSILISLASVAIVILLVEYFRNRRRNGVAVFVHLPSLGDGEIDGSMLSQVDEWMQKRHRAWFRAGPMRDDLSGKPSSRAEWALKTMRFRLDEAELLAKDSPDLFLYFLARNPDAFALGFSLRSAIPSSPRSGIQALSSVFAATEFRMQVRVHQVSLFDDKVTLNEANLSDVTSSPRTERMSDVAIVGDGRLPGDVERLALVVYAASTGVRGDEARMAFFGEALRAASGESGTHYLVESDDVCDRFLEVVVDWGSLSDGMKDGTSGRSISVIRDAWSRHCMEQYGRRDVPVRLFLNGSALVAFAAGVFLPPGSRLVPYSGGLPQLTSVSANLSMPITAILDGDDVGQAIEGHMLRNDVGGVLDASAAVSASLESLGRLLSGIPGVKQLSFGGDSALFQIESESVGLFVQELEVARKLTGFRFSCGYGPDMRSAFIALRSAKASGKNVTHSYQSL